MENITHQSFARTDSEGNVLLVRFTIVDGVKKTASVVLKLRGHARDRNIGFITLEDNTLHAKRTASKHYHIKAKGYGFNWDMLNEQTMFRIDHIHLIIDNEKHYLFPKSVMDSHGRFLYFKRQSFELQRFLDMTFIEPFERKEIIQTVSKFIEGL